MTFWMKLKALPAVWRNMDALLLSLALSRAAADQLSANAKLMQEGGRMLAEQQTEVDRMNRVAAEDAKLLLAYARWCQKQGCPPSSKDLMDMVK
jgi:Rieske Fe-S protein